MNMNKSIYLLYLFICTSVAEKTRLDTGVGLLLYKRICSQIASPPQSSIVNGLPGSEVKIPGREMGAGNLTALMCALLVSVTLAN